jgi:hypothetical protein
MTVRRPAHRVSSALLEALRRSVGGAAAEKAPQNAQLLQQMESNPLRSSLAKALDIAEEFQGAIEFVSGNRDLSPEGRQKATQAHLRKAIRDLRDARGPLNDLQAKLDAKRKAVAIPAFDPNDIVGFLRRQELRATLRTMDAGQRAMFLANDPAFADAMLEQPPALSGLLPNENFIVDAAASLEGLAAKFGVDRDAIWRHWHDHVSAEMKAGYLIGPAELATLGERAAIECWRLPNAATDPHFTI